MVEDITPVATTQESWWQIIQTKLHLDRFMEYLTESKEHLLEIGLYAGLGFLSGFFVKKFSTFVIMLLIFIGALIVFQQFNILSISLNWESLYTYFNIQQPPTLMDDNFLVILWAWIKINWVICLSYAIGFLIGLKVA